MQGDVDVSRSCLLEPDNLLPPPCPPARAPPVIAAAAVHMEMAVAPGSREALRSCHGISCVAVACIAGAHDHTVGSSTRPQMLGRGALDVSDRRRHVCVLHVYMCVCILTEA